MLRSTVAPAAHSRVPLIRPQRSQPRAGAVSLTNKPVRAGFRKARNRNRTGRPYDADIQVPL